MPSRVALLVALLSVPALALENQPSAETSDATCEGSSSTSKALLQVQAAGTPAASFTEQGIADVQDQGLTDSKSLSGPARTMTDLRHRGVVAQSILNMLGLNSSFPNEDALMHELEESIKLAGQHITEGHTEDHGILQQQTDLYDRWANNVAVKTVCETGFNAGHSSARFLAQSAAQVYQFDLGAHDYGKTANAFLTAKFPGRLFVTWGDSMYTLPQFHANHPGIKCDVVIVDGGHEVANAGSDLKNFAPMASKNHILAIDDTPCSADWCWGPTRAWKTLKQHGCIKELSSVRMGATRGFSTGHFTPCHLWPTLGK